MEDLFDIFGSRADENISGCAASIVRLVYSVQSTQTEDQTYLQGKLQLWAVVEATCGILAVCLPISPKFFRSLHDSELWSVLRGFSFSRSKTELAGSSRDPGDSEAPPDEKSKTAKLSSSGTPNFKAYFKRYNYRSVNETELDSISSQAGIAKSIRDRRDGVGLA